MIGNFIGAPVGGIVSSGNTGTLAVTLDDITLSASGALAIAGQVTATLDDAILVAAGALALSGAAAIVLDDATLLATGELSIHGWEGTLLDDVELIATAHVAARVLSRIHVGCSIHAPGSAGYGLTRIRVSGGRR